MPLAFVFPGQGSQHVGMGKVLAEAHPPARQVFDEVDDALGQKLSTLMFEGPEDELQLTENTQPALMAVSMAVVRTVEAEGEFSLSERCEFVAGHSLGEYSALAAAGAFSISDAAKLLKTRGQAMQKAVPVGEGAMAALLGLDLPDVQKIAEEAAGEDVCEAANDNAPGQVVISGHKAAVERAVELASERGARRSVLLPVSAPFHCALMKPAAEVMADALEEANIEKPVPPVVANVTAEAVEDPKTIRDLLVRQVTAPVRWRESVLYMKEKGIDTMAELGAGKVLSGLARRIDRELTGMAVNTPEDIEALLKSL